VALAPEHLYSWTNQRIDSPVVRCESAVMTAGQLEERSRRLAQALHGEGVTEGIAFGILARNRIEWPELMLGNVRARSRYVPLNWHLTPHEIAELLIDSSSQLLVVDASDEEAGRDAAARAGIATVVVLGAEYEEWIASASDAPLDDGQAGRPLLYTGGTTGRSKGVTRSDMNIDVSQYGQVAGRWGALTEMPMDGRALLCTPAYHALGYGLMQSALARGHSVEIQPSFDPIGTLKLIEESRITTTAMVPTQFIRMLKATDDNRSVADVSSLEWVLHTAAPCPAWVKRAMIEWFGPVIVELYGSSEGTGPVLCTSEEWLAHPGTVGRASAALTLSIVDDDGHDLPAGEIGTVYVKRHDGTPTYHGDPEKTSSIQLPDGRFTVGDIGWLDDDGYLYLADRRTDLIIRGGSNIYPAEIEAVLSEHPGVADVAVFGVPDEDFGQAVKAVVQPSGAVAADELVQALHAFAAERLASFKLPATIDLRDDLPREESGKLKKRLLRDPFWEHSGNVR